MANLTDTYYAAEGSFHGYGTQLLVGDGASPETFEAIAEVKTFTFGDMTTATFDRTHLRSPDAHTEIEAALRSSAAFSAVCNYRPTHESQSNAGGGSGSFTGGGLLKMWRDRSTHNFKIVLSDGSPGTEVPFTGFVSKYQPGTLGPDGGIDLSVEFQPKNGAWHADLP
jgi:hypothetical protein